MTYIFTRHAEFPKPQPLNRSRAEWLTSQTFGPVYTLQKLRELTNGKIDHIDVRDGRITIEKGTK